MAHKEKIIFLTSLDPIKILRVISPDDYEDMVSIQLNE